VVDDDVDIRNASDVEWAMATRLDPKTGIVTIDNIFGHGLNPSFPDYFGSKVGFDATRAFPHRYEHDRAFYKKVELAKYEIAVPDMKAAKQRAKAEADAEAKREAERKAREAAVVPTEAPNIMREEDAPGAASPAPAPVPLPPSRPVTRGSAAPAAALAPAGSESAPALPPPVDIRPAPAARRANTHRSDPNRRAGSVSGNAAPPPRPAPNVFERLFGLGR